MTYIPRSSSSMPGPTGSIPTLVRKKRTFRVFNTLASLAFALSIVGAVGVYLLGQYADSKLDEARIALEQVSNTDDRQRVEAVGTFDQRLETARTLLDRHLSPLGVFERFEDITKQTVQLTGFTYEYDPGFEATLEFSANTAALSSIALQHLDLAVNSLFTEFVMRDITMGSDEEGGGGVQAAGGITAQFAGILDTTQFAYGAEEATVTPVEPQPVETPAAVEAEATTTPEVTTEEATEDVTE